MEKKLNKPALIRKITGIAIAAALTLGSSVTALAAGGTQRNLIPMGNTVGINLHSNGVLVVALTDESKPKKNENNLMPGDLILQIGSDTIETGEDVTNAVLKFDGTPISVKVMRGDSPVQLTITPRDNGSGGFELGVWLRDGMAGIGTLTFYDPKTGVFGALGHAVNDADTGVTVPLRDGVIMPSSITDVIPGKSGEPGQLIGSFDAGNEIGILRLNTDSGIFGDMSNLNMVTNRAEVPVGYADEIKTGPATILSNVSGNTVKEYDIQITRVYSGSESGGRSMMISVCDDNLIARTGGIVQGMSGSPIIQNGKIIGAVTHVLVNDPLKGYGISIEQMLDTAYGNEGAMAA